jgi:hypothetical protein
MKTPSKSRRFSYDRMSYQQFRAALEQLDMPWMDFAKVSGKNPRKVEGWYNGKDDIPHEVMLICSLLTLPGAKELASTVTDAVNHFHGEHWSYDRMNYQQFRAALEELDMPRLYFSKISGKHPRRVEDWYNGYEDIPHEVMVLCSLLTLPGAKELASTVTNAVIHFHGEQESNA